MINVEELRNYIGRVSITREQVSPEVADRFNAIFDRSSELLQGCKAPPLLHFCLALPSSPTSQLTDDGHPARGAFLPPVPLPRRMWAGGSIEFIRDIHIGDIVERQSRVADVQVKQGRSGLLCFVVLEHEIWCDEEVLIKERQDIVYREAKSAQSPKALEVDSPAPAGTYIRTVIPTPILLFRYSAISFNSHRIHYDRKYCETVESYPGLVVQGPLQATLLMQLATDLRRENPKTFSFRMSTPLFDTSEFCVHASEEGNTLKLWTAQSRGPIAMEARANWL